MQTAVDSLTRDTLVGNLLAHICYSAPALECVILTILYIH